MIIGTIATSLRPRPASQSFSLDASVKTEPADAQGRREHQARRITVFPKWQGTNGNAEIVDVDYEIEVRNRSDEVVTDLKIRAWTVDEQGHDIPEADPQEWTPVVALSPGEPDHPQDGRSLAWPTRTPESQCLGPIRVH